MNEENIENQVPIGAPDWTNPASYINHESWTNKTWAWEFLRRNKEYQRKCKENAKENTEIKKALAKDFGRCNLKHFRRAYYPSEENEKLWLSETIVKKRTWHDTDDAKTELDLSRGEVALVFDLKQVRYGGTAAITTLLNHAKEILFKELQTYGKKLDADEKPSISKPRRKRFFLLLRLYDAKEHNKASNEDIMKILYASKLEKGKPISADKKIELGKTISADFIKAKKMVQSGYLSLVPLAND